MICVPDDDKNLEEEAFVIGEMIIELIAESDQAAGVEVVRRKSD